MNRHYEKGQLIYISPGSVRFDLEDIEFLLPYLEQMREGLGPVPPESGYVGENRSGIKAYGKHEAWCQVAAEIDRRLARTGLDRFIIEHFYIKQTPVETIAIMIFQTTREIERRIKSSISYISSGPCPRWQNCIDCLKHSKCKRKKRVGITYRQWKRYKNREENRKSGHKSRIH